MDNVNYIVMADGLVTYRFVLSDGEVREFDDLDGPPGSRPRTKSTRWRWCFQTATFTRYRSLSAACSNRDTKTRLT